ncbi:hypothetical protein ACFLRG_01100, partial [Bacteroidota bacterium]
MSQIVDLIVEDCSGHLDAIVATHRHKDHISAFGLKGLCDKLISLNPDLVIQPWTEHPDADSEALKSPEIFTNKNINHLKSLRNAELFASDISKYANQILGRANARTHKQIMNLVSLSGIHNKNAVTNLSKMGVTNAYVHTGSKSGLENILPGVQITVLGPPTLEQTNTIKKQTSWNKDEFWNLYSKVSKVSYSNTASKMGKSYLFPNAKKTVIGKAHSYVKWLVKQLDNIQVENMKNIVRSLDNALNNTSVILLFEVGDTGILFPGDAQLESWQYILSQKQLKSKLSNVILYKVGHHGSTNATPKSLWNIIQNQYNKNKCLISLISTKEGHHSEVPRKSLLNALENNSDLFSTQGWKKQLKKEFTIL